MQRFKAAMQLTGSEFLEAVQYAAKVSRACELSRCKAQRRTKVWRRCNRCRWLAINS